MSRLSSRSSAGSMSVGKRTCRVMMRWRWEGGVRDRGFEEVGVEERGMVAMRERRALRMVRGGGRVGGGGIFVGGSGGGWGVVGVRWLGLGWDPVVGVYGLVAGLASGCRWGDGGDGALGLWFGAAGRREGPVGVLGWRMRDPNPWDGGQEVYPRELSSFVVVFDW